MKTEKKGFMMTTKKTLTMLSFIFSSIAIVYAGPDETFRNEKYFEFYEKTSIAKPADIGTVTLKIQTENESFNKAIEENKTLRESIISSIKKSGLKSENIKTSNYSSIPVSGFFSGKVKKHKIENRIDVVIRNEDELGLVANVVDANASVEYVGIKFSLENEDSLKSELRQTAFTNAKKKQKEIEEAFKVKLKLVGYKENEVNDVQYFDRGIKMKSMAYDMVLQEEAAPEAAFNSLKFDTGILFTFQISE